MRIMRRKLQREIWWALNAFLSCTKMGPLASIVWEKAVMKLWGANSLCVWCSYKLQWGFDWHRDEKIMTEFHFRVSYSFDFCLIVSCVLKKKNRTDTRQISRFCCRPTFWFSLIRWVHFNIKNLSLRSLNNKEEVFQGVQQHIWSRLTCQYVF